MMETRTELWTNVFFLVFFIALGIFALHLNDVAWAAGNFFVAGWSFGDIKEYLTKRFLP